jgi:hypothetical protein
MREVTLAPFCTTLHQICGAKHQSQRPEDDSEEEEDDDAKVGLL